MKKSRQKGRGEIFMQVDRKESGQLLITEFTLQDIVEELIEQVRDTQPATGTILQGEGAFEITIKKVPFPWEDSRCK